MDDIFNSPSSAEADAAFWALADSALGGADFAASDGSTASVQPQPQRGMPFAPGYLPPATQQPLTGPHAMHRGMATGNTTSYQPFPQRVMTPVTAYPPPAMQQPFAGSHPGMATGSTMAHQPFTQSTMAPAPFPPAAQQPQYSLVGNGAQNTTVIAGNSFNYYQPMYQGMGIPAPPAAGQYFNGGYNRTPTSSGFVAPDASVDVRSSSGSQSTLARTPPSSASSASFIDLTTSSDDEAQHALQHAGSSSRGKKRARESAADIDSPPKRSRVGMVTDPRLTRPASAAALSAVPRASADAGSSAAKGPSSREIAREVRLAYLLGRERERVHLKPRNPQLNPLPVAVAVHSPAPKQDAPTSKRGDLAPNNGDSTIETPAAPLAKAPRKRGPRRNKNDPRYDASMLGNDAGLSLDEQQVSLLARMAKAKVESDQAALQSTPTDDNADAQEATPEPEPALPVAAARAATPPPAPAPVNFEFEFEEDGPAPIDGELVLANPEDPVRTTTTRSASIVIAESVSSSYSSPLKPTSLRAYADSGAATSPVAAMESEQTTASANSSNEDDLAAAIQAEFDKYGAAAGYSSDDGSLFED